MAPATPGRCRMGACETTPTTTHTGKPARPPPKPSDPETSRLFLAPDHRPPLARLQLVRPRPAPWQAPRLRALQLDPDRAAARNPAPARKARRTVHPARRSPAGHRANPPRPLDKGTPHGCANLEVELRGLDPLTPCLQIAVINEDSWPDLRGWPSVSDRGVPSATRVNGTLMARRDGRRRTQGQHQPQANRHWSVDLASGLLDDPACARID
jgi:hypothetical protein